MAECPHGLTRADVGPLRLDRPIPRSIQTLTIIRAEDCPACLKERIKLAEEVIRLAYDLGFHRPETILKHHEYVVRYNP